MYLCDTYIVSIILELSGYVISSGLLSGIIEPKYSAIFGLELGMPHMVVTIRSLFSLNYLDTLRQILLNRVEGCPYVLFSSLFSVFKADYVGLIFVCVEFLDVNSGRCFYLLLVLAENAKILSKGCGVLGSLNIKL